jgi:hypothetical protein
MATKCGACNGERYIDGNQCRVCGGRGVEKMTFEQWRDKTGFPVNTTQEPLWRECWRTAQENT